MLGEAFRPRSGTRSAAADGYDAGSGVDTSSRKARMATAMQQFVDRFEDIPLVVLACQAGPLPAD